MDGSHATKLYAFAELETFLFIDLRQTIPILGNRSYRADV